MDALPPESPDNQVEGDKVPHYPRYLWFCAAATAVALGACENGRAGDGTQTATSADRARDGASTAIRPEPSPSRSAGARAATAAPAAPAAAAQAPIEAAENRTGVPLGRYLLTWRPESGDDVSVTVTVKAADGSIVPSAETTLEAEFSSRGGALSGCALRDSAKNHGPVEAECSMTGERLTIKIGKPKDAGSSIFVELTPQDRRRFTGSLMATAAIFPGPIRIGKAWMIPLD